MRLSKPFNKGVSVLEYMILLIVLLGALFVMKDYILRGFAGRYKAAGEALSFGRQFDVDTTTQCAFDMVHEDKTANDAGTPRGEERWYDVKCARQKMVDLECNFRSNDYESCKQDAVAECITEACNPAEPGAAN